MSAEVLSVAQSGEADRLAASAGVVSLVLMENAGRAIAGVVSALRPAGQILVLCGPGNNGGDGYCAARHLRARDFPVQLCSLTGPSLMKGDAAAMAKLWGGPVAGPEQVKLGDGTIVVDALFGAGLSRPLDGAAADLVRTLNSGSARVIAVDVPSGLHGDLARPLEGREGLCMRAERTVTFFRPKPAHFLMPGRIFCGQVTVADIGIPDEVLGEIRPKLFANGPSLWRQRFPAPAPDGHKYRRGHAVIVSGPMHATGAARLAARGALRAGAGLVSVASPFDAIGVNAAQLTAVMVKPFDGATGLSELLSDHRLNAIGIGPGCGIGTATQDLVAAVLASGAAAVLDADALTSFADDPNLLFRQLHGRCVLTPHEGEFERIFPGALAARATRIDAAREAAVLAGCAVLLKGADTVIASPDGRAVINHNAPPFLATGGAGDVLTGIIAGLLAQGMQSFDAACAGAWLHGEAAAKFGPGLIAEDLPEQIPAVYRSQNLL